MVNSVVVSKKIKKVNPTRWVFCMLDGYGGNWTDTCNCIRLAQEHGKKGSKMKGVTKRAIWEGVLAWEGNCISGGQHYVCIF